MGIYVFKKEQLVKMLKEDYVKSNDFGGEIIPAAAKDGNKVVAYLFNDYWEDIGTIKSFFEANLALAQQVPSYFNESRENSLMEDLKPFSHPYGIITIIIYVYTLSCALDRNWCSNSLCAIF